MKNLSDTKKPKVHIGIIGHVDHGKHTLTEAIKMVAMQTARPEAEEIHPIVIYTNEEFKEVDGRNVKKRSKKH